MHLCICKCMNVCVYVPRYTHTHMCIQICRYFWAPSNYTVSGRKTIQIVATCSLFSVTWRIDNFDNISLWKSLSPSGATRDAGFFGRSIELGPWRVSSDLKVLFAPYELGARRGCWSFNPWEILVQLGFPHHEPAQAQEKLYSLMLFRFLFWPWNCFFFLNYI